MFHSYFKPLVPRRALQLRRQVHGKLQALRERSATGLFWGMSCNLQNLQAENYNWLVGQGHPSEKYESQLG